MTTVGTCAKCGANLALVGKMHRCVPRPATPPPMPVTHIVTHAVTHAEPDCAQPKPARSKGAARQARYRAKDPEAYRQRHRDYMRARRAAARAQPQP
jgi:hypothetical protein